MLDSRFDTPDSRFDASECPLLSLYGHSCMPARGVVNTSGWLVERLSTARLLEVPKCSLQHTVREDRSDDHATFERVEATARRHFALNFGR